MFFATPPPPTCGINMNICELVAPADLLSSRSSISTGYESSAMGKGSEPGQPCTPTGEDQSRHGEDGLMSSRSRSSPPHGNRLVLLFLRVVLCAGRRRGRPWYWSWRLYIGDMLVMVLEYVGMYVPHGRQTTNAAPQNDNFEHSSDDSSRSGRWARKFATLTYQRLCFSQTAMLVDMVVVPANMLHHRLLGRCSTHQSGKRR